MRLPLSKSQTHKRQAVALHARQMRSALTPSEQTLWSAINAGKLGVCFRRQVPIGSFIADFAAPAARLIIEVDGGYHARRRTADARRDRKLARLGYRVLHIEARLVEQNLHAALALIRDALRQLP